MSEELARSKQYGYKENSNLVFYSERNRSELKEPKGEPETLWGRLRGEMGDRVNYSKPLELLEKMQNLKRKTIEKEGGDVNSSNDTYSTTKKVKNQNPLEKKSTNRKSNGNNNNEKPIDILSATESFQGLYKPKTKETRITYETLLTFIQRYVGDQPTEVVKGALDEILSILKDDTIRAPEKKIEISKLLKGLNDVSFAELTQLGKQITDFKDSELAKQQQQQQQQQSMDSLDDEQGVAVIIDEEEEEENLSDFEIRDDDDDDDDVDNNEVDDNNNNDSEAQDSEIQTKDENNNDDDENQKIKENNNNNNKSQKPDTKNTKDDKNNNSKLISPNEIDSFWIQRKISEFERDHDLSKQLAEKTLNILRQPNVRRCEQQLVDLFTIDKLDFLKLIINNKQTILYCTLLAKAENDQERKKIEDEMSSNPVTLSILNRLKGNEVTAATTEKTIEKTESNKKDVEMKQQQQQQQDEIKKPKKLLNLEELSFQQGSHLMTNKEFKFPKGSKREQYKGFEEIHVPARANPPFNPNERLISIEELPEWSRLPFEESGVKSLNRVQSKLFDCAFKTDNNLLLSAPTSSGKTNVAMLTILHEIGKNRDRDSGKIRLDAFKIVYIAPMKSLVQEMVGNFSKRLKSYGIVVNELTGDQSLTNKQISETQIIVTTPEKWDIITRKSGDRAYTQLVKLIIIDEIHLLHDERGPVLECIVARTLRMIESTQQMVRLVGLSATLPNYEDVATFLRVEPDGVFYFDSSYRPIPLEQQYIGISDRGIKQLQRCNDITFTKVSERVGDHQILIFVHSRRETAKTGKDLRDRAVEDQSIDRYIRDPASREILRATASKQIQNAELKDLLPYGIGIHHAGLSRSDRSLVEDLFGDNRIQVLISTATLAWGVNLPAHTVIIKGTQIYNPEKGWCELSPLDVTQMLGRAGRPPFDKEGEGIIITSQHELQFYLSLLNTQLSIESQFISRIADNLNAEIVLGSIQTVRDAVNWLGYTYLYICMIRNPPLYEISYDDFEKDPLLEQRRLDLVHSAATILEKNSLIKYDRKSGKLQSTELGKVASHYYITNSSMSIYQEHLKPSMSDIELLRVFSLSSEFKNVVVREGEKFELEKLLERVPIPIKENIEEPSSKINVLLQTYISNLKLDGFALVVDMFYIAQSASRITRALFEIVLKKGWAQLAKKILNLAKMIDSKMWSSQSPLRQFHKISPKVLNQLERRGIPIEDLYEYNSQQLGNAIQNPSEGKQLFDLIHNFPKLDLTAHVQPILHGLLRVELSITPDFQYDERYHNNSIGWWIIVEDVDGERILYFEYFSLKKKMVNGEDQLVSFTVPLSQPLPPQYYVRVISDHWIGAEYSLPISFQHLILPEKYPPCRPLLDLQPLPIQVLKDPKAESIFKPTFSIFNAIQTQVFNCMYQSNDNAFISAPTNSGKTVCAEIALIRCFKQNPKAKVVYLAPMQDLASVRLKDWSNKFGVKSPFGLVVSDLTGDAVTDNKILDRSNIIVTNCEKWDILSRKWKQRKALQSINLLIVDELHLIGGEYGPTMEIVVSRMRYISTQTGNALRVIALSSSIANARDLVLWIGATPQTCYNFHPNVRPIPVEYQIQGFEFPHFNARMLAMTKPTVYEVAKNKNQQSIVFVPTRKLSRSLAADIIANVSSFEDTLTKPYLVCEEHVLTPYLEDVDSFALKQSLQMGVAFYHDGLTERERRVVEILFRSGSIRVLIATHSVAWLLDNVFAQLVVIMGTQLYQGKDIRYIDYPINDILQMIGRAGKQEGGGVISNKVAKVLLLCHAPKKEYYKMFLNEPLPVESHLDHCLHDQFNSEIVTKTITKKQDALDYLTWTFLYRRLNQNPNYYNLSGVSHLHLSEHLSELVENTLVELEQSNCITIQDDQDKVSPLNLGIIASYYYLKYQTIELFGSSLKSTTRRRGIMDIISNAPEFNSLPIRHREDQILMKLASHLPQKIDKPNYQEISTKVNVLLQCHFSRESISADLYQDQKFILENATRLLQAIVDVISSNSWLQPAIAAMELSQMITQAMWDSDSVFKQLPHMNKRRIDAITSQGIESVFDLMSLDDNSRIQLLDLSQQESNDLVQSFMKYPDIDISYQVQDEDDLHADSIMTVEMVIERDLGDDEENPIEINDSINVVSAPYYPKEKICGWWALIGDSKNNHLLAIKRITFLKKTKVKFEFPTPAVGKHQLSLYLFSDSYNGCDQEHELNINILPAEIEDEDEDEEEDNEMDE
ncbi:DEAD/DEAH box helicase [Dictyostelium discoideum AX4]|uniref:Activating signal cointegrator 1 complex subunit 3-like n=1 Tax=Dictyostelium discoideum TaxID=44689 RepID=HELCL_DICDI|nr:DEAD/DEAH box helicase [Dictyostelium discoideum AX4]Q55CI8.1 RecName: Full=Activating signal cointegrator 1 complex subunit 3-like [Dictyostelium discoideum]EAL72371.1 DEAD/DEAH box helicase [Dictyostelium discoideum AX4]|eukprot:XP_646493.1 DEAD/DEAH box helicase [Dictyostelium discoideum AX4]